MARMTEREAQKLLKRLGQSTDQVATKTVRQYCAIDGDTPQERLWRLLVKHYGCEDFTWEYRNAVPGRRYRIDIAIPEHHIAIECDGYGHHGKFLSDFKRDRDRQNLLSVHGWTVLRFYVAQINNDPEGIIDQVKKAIEIKISMLKE